MYKKQHALSASTQYTARISKHTVVFDVYPSRAVTAQSG
jgi:hypothetical protein